MKSNNGILTEKEIRARTKFWNRKQFRTWDRKELEKNSIYMQSLLAALKGFRMDKIEAIKKLNTYSIRAYRKNDPGIIVWLADQKDLDYAVSTAPKTFKVKQG